MDVFWLDGALVGFDDRSIAEPAEGATVALWHPIRRGMDAIVGWREFLERHGLCRPFKQAHREVYLLTDAERATRVYPTLSAPRGSTRIGSRRMSCVSTSSTRCALRGAGEIGSG